MFLNNILIFINEFTGYYNKEYGTQYYCDICGRRSFSSRYSHIKNKKHIDLLDKCYGQVEDNREYIEENKEGILFYPNFINDYPYVSTYINYDLCKLILKDVDDNRKINEILLEK